MNKYLVLAATCVGLIFSASTAQAAEPLAFQQVMKDLGKHMQTITGAISREDWELVERTAPSIAEHPQPPPAEKARIISFMGSNMGKFKGFDGETHEAAHEMLLAAQAKDGQKVIDSFQKVQSTCLACHQTFRVPFVAHFYGMQETENTRSR
ncbi:MAG: cytochrome c [Gallionella sp.]